MPRANRHFLPGHVWHITINTPVSSNRSKRSTAALRFKQFKQRASVNQVYGVIGAVTYIGSSRRRSVLDYVFSIT